MKCKFTGKRIKPFMSFGKMPIANGFLKKKDFKKEFFYNMEVAFSKEMSLFQIADHPSPSKMFHKNYPFYTSSSKDMVEHFKRYFEWSKKFLSADSKIIEIGSNDGSFLVNFKNQKFDCIGFEPSKNVSDYANKRGLKSINKFFNLKSISKIKNYMNQTDLICAANAICHIPNIKELFTCVDKLLSKNGVFIFEEPYLGSVFEKTSYDQIYDEHIFIFSGSAIKKIAKKFNMRLIDMIPQKTHGGSMRYVVTRNVNKHNISNRVKKTILKEKKKNLDNGLFCNKFKTNCEKLKKKLRKKLIKLKSQNKKIFGYAATSKSTTILNYCDIGPEIIDFITDTTPEKINKYSPGKHIPIINHKEFFKKNYDVAVLFAWNHQKEIFKKEKKFSSNGGKWLTFFPNIKIW
jgi:methylation protein EvaC